MRIALTCGDFARFIVLSVGVSGYRSGCNTALVPSSLRFIRSPVPAESMPEHQILLFADFLDVQARSAFACSTAPRLGSHRTALLMPRPTIS